MPKVRTTYICRQCGAFQHRWVGKCPDCGAWDSLEEARLDANAEKDPQKGLAQAWSAAASAIAEGESAASVIELSPGASPKAEPIDRPSSDPAPARLATGIGEFDRVLGGGVVAGSVVLVGGDPGIGKSTLMLQGAAALARAGVRTLYVTSEESAEQTRLRFARLSHDQPASDLYVLADTNLARIVEQARRTQPRILVIDSIQMIYKANLDASPGSIAQLRRCCTELVYLAKASGVAILLVGHVTKDGALAGPRLLEHLVDAVLYFEGDRHHAHRVIRAVKNRFGTTLELGLFEMSDRGLRELADGAGVAAEAGPARPGSVVCPAMAGARCLLVELQALTATGFLGAAKRKASGVDANRLAMLIAVLEQHAGLRLADRDVFASAVGGVRIVEPAADLALALAIAGSHLKRALSRQAIAVGEIGLGGEIRAVSGLDQRLREAARLGYTSAIAPRAKGLRAPKGLELVQVASIGEAIDHLA